MNLWMNQSACAGFVIMETPQVLTPDLGLAINSCSMVQQHFSNACPVILRSHVQRCETVLFYKHTEWVKLLLISNIVLCVCICKCKYVYLIAHINICMFGEQQRDNVHTALLCCQVEGADALPGHCVTLRPIFQQRCTNLQFILLSCNVERCVAILERERNKMQRFSNFFWTFLDYTNQAETARL